MQLFGTPVPTAEEMYTARGLMAAEVTKESKLSQAAAHRGQEHTQRLPTVAGKHAGFTNPLADMMKYMVSDPKAKPSAAPKVVSKLPAHVQRAKA
eukprot:7450890-Heterocapsa_arctica.AAC.1